MRFQGSEKGGPLWRGRGGSWWGWGAHLLPPGFARTVCSLPTPRLSPASAFPATWCGHRDQSSGLSQGPSRWKVLGATHSLAALARGGDENATGQGAAPDLTGVLCKGHLGTQWVSAMTVAGGHPKSVRCHADLVYAVPDGRALLCGQPLLASSLPHVNVPPRTS